MGEEISAGSGMGCTSPVWTSTCASVERPSEMTEVKMRRPSETEAGRLSKLWMPGAMRPEWVTRSILGISAVWPDPAQ